LAGTRRQRSSTRKKVLQARQKAPLSVSIVVRTLCICISGPFPDSARGNAQWSGQPRDGSRPARASLWKLGRRTDALARAWRAIRFPIHKRFPLEHQKRAERAICKLEQVSRNGRCRFWYADRSAGVVFPCDSTLARRRQSRSISGAI